MRRDVRGSYQTTDSCKDGGQPAFGVSIMADVIVTPYFDVFLRLLKSFPYNEIAEVSRVYGVATEAAHLQDTLPSNPNRVQVEKGIRNYPVAGSIQAGNAL
jgi:hypothetical protein